MVSFVIRIELLWGKKTKKQTNNKQINKQNNKRSNEPFAIIGRLNYKPRYCPLISSTAFSLCFKIIVFSGK